MQNKVDLVSKQDAMKNHKQIKDFIKNTKYRDAPIIPISAQHRVNIDVLLEAIEKYFPTPKRDLNKAPLMVVARSFDINKPGADIEKIIGGVLGGCIKQGKIKTGDEIRTILGQYKKSWLY